MVISGSWLTADQKSCDSAEIFLWSKITNLKLKKRENWWRLSSDVDLLTGMGNPHCAKLGYSPCPCQRQFGVRVRFKSLKKYTFF